MSIARIKRELEAAQARITSLGDEIAAITRWQGELIISLSVLQRLDDVSEDDQADQQSTSDDATAADGENVRQTNRRSRSDVVTRAEAAMIELLRERGDNIRQADAVTLLRERYGIVVGLGKPGRETSDLSAALGRSPGLRVSRTQGWRLTEWGETTKAERDAAEDQRRYEVDASAYDRPSDDSGANDRPFD